MKRAFLLVLLFGSLTGCLSQGKTVTADEFGDTWPFTVSEGKIHCFDSRELVFESGGVRYSINGWAETFAEQKGYSQDLKQIWRKNPKYPDLDIFISIGAVMNAAEELC